MEDAFRSRVAVSLLALSGAAATNWTDADLWAWPDSPAGASGDPSAIGQWAEPQDIPDDLNPGQGISPVHSALFPYGEKGKLVAFRNTRFKIYDLNVTSSEITKEFGTADPDDGDHKPFCNGASFTPDGRLLIVGGSLWQDTETFGGCTPNDLGWASIFDPNGTGGGTLTRTQDTQLGTYDYPTNYARYYPSCATLPDGTILTLTGDAWIQDMGDPCWSDDDNELVANNGFWEVWKPGTEQWNNVKYRPSNPQTYLDFRGFPGSDDGMAPEVWPYYPHIKILPSGIFWEGHDNATAAMSSVFWKWDVTGATVVDQRQEGLRNESSCVVLTLGSSLTDPQTILLIGGGTKEDISTEAEIITYTDNGSGSITTSGWSVSSLASTGGRRRPDAIMLPDGEVLLVGGEDYRDVQGVPHPNLDVELYQARDAAPSWTLMDGLENARMYHSNALLLPDGRVFVAGDEGEGPSQNDLDGRTYEIFYPPYLFASSTTWADRPLITDLPDEMHYGLDAVITIDHEDATKTAEDIIEVCLVKTGASTHATNMTQRRVLLDFDDYPGDSETLVVTPPANGRWAPPGYYMLFVLDDDGVPSVGKFVKIHGEGNHVVPDGETAIWAGECHLDRSFLVESGATLEILAGTVVTADETVAGTTQEEIKIVVDGKLVVNGTESDPVTFTTTGDDWGGILFQDADDDRMSEIRHADFEYPVFGVQLDSLACTLFKPSFMGSEQADIRVERDTRLPAGGVWNLEAPTEVEVLGATGQNPRIGIVINGHLETSDPSDTGQLVTFTSSVADAAAGNAWQGVTIQGTVWTGDGVGTASIEDAEFEYAAYPLSFFLADTLNGTGPRVAHSEFHHYKDEAILDWASDALVDSNTVYRGDMDDDPAYGRVGIHKASSAGRVIGNEVYWQGERGIWADYTSGHCTAPTQTEPTELLPIEENDVIGTPPENLSGGIGIDVSWACREQNVEVKNNNVRNWTDVGVKLRQSSDVAVSCNCIMGNGIGVMHRRDQLDWDGTEDGYSTLKDNRLLVNATNVQTFRWGPGDEPTEQTGPQTSGLCGGGGANCPSAGGNILRLLNQNATNWELDAGEGRTDFARSNLWKDESGTVLTNLATIEDTNVWDVQVANQEIDEASFLSSGGAGCVQSCTVPVPPPGALPQRGEVLTADRDTGRPGGAALGAVAPAVPTELKLFPPRPNPSRGTVSFRLDIPASQAGPAEIAIYSAAGRRVRTVLAAEMLPGSHVIHWDGRDQGGRVTGSGVYFATIEAGGQRSIRRIVVLH